MSVPKQPKSEGWRRDWPMLAGLAVSASLIFASTVVGAPSADDSAPRPAAKAAAGTGTSASAPTAEAAAPAAAADESAGATAKPARKTKKRKKKKAKPGKAAATVDSTPAVSTPAPAKSKPRPTPSKPNTPMILNVKGTSGAGRQGGVEFQFSAAGHSPAMGALWTITTTATKSGMPVSGTVRVDAVHKGQVVGKIHRGKLASGKYRHSIRWPKEAVGQALVVKTSIEAGGVTQTFLFDVRVRPAG